MTAETGERQWKCLFVAEWSCQMEVDEVPLEVCRLCIEARRNHANGRAEMIERPTGRAEAPKPLGGEGARKTLLARALFINGEIDVETYLRRRKDVVGRASK